MSKNIVLFSDGTGQRGGVGYESNVWRLFHAIEHDDQQLRCYDDGVGTEDFKLFKMLGGGMGMGLGRNVRELYRFLVRHYQPDDKIYLFGFSRGAFTVRLLAGMIANCGIINIHNKKIQSEKELDQLIHAAYCSYRSRRYKPERVQHFCELYSHHPDGKQPIEFVGVWDTVDALGVPFDELREVIDRILHYSFKDYYLHPNIKHASHAVAIDDERKTFHPVMWDERKEENNRIEQVWFSGVHSNVGGGYPKKEMAMVTLDWMMKQANDHGLRIIPNQWQAVKEEADITGKLYDSRSGFGAYYRYLPRNLEDIRQIYTNGPLKLHPSALERVDKASNNYSPFNLPENNSLEDGSIGFNSSESWKEAMAYAWDTVWWRRVVYYCFILLSLFTLALPAIHNYLPTIDSQAIHWLGANLTLLTVQLADLAGISWLVESSIGNSIISTFIAKPFIPVAIFLVAAILLIARQRCKRTGNCMASAGWASIYPEHRPQLSEDLIRARGSWLLKIARCARGSSLLKGIATFIQEAFITSMVIVLFPILRSVRMVRDWLCFRGKVLADLRKGAKKRG